MSGSQDGGQAWTQELIRFLEDQPRVTAVRLNTADMKVSVATLGAVDDARLEQSIQQVLLAIEAKLAEGRSGSGAMTQPGFVVRQAGSVTTIERPTCETAPRLYRWQEYSLPEEEHVDEHEHGHGHGHGGEEGEWRLLATLASICAVAGVAGFAAEKFGAPAWLSLALYGVALIAGGWDAAIDSWENLRHRKLDIHFLMLAVAVGASLVGAYGEAVLLLFLFSASGAMEAYAMERTQREVSSLLHTAPKEATIVAADGSHRQVAVEQLRVGDRVAVKPGEMFAADHAGVQFGNVAAHLAQDFDQARTRRVKADVLDRQLAARNDQGGDDEECG